MTPQGPAAEAITDLTLLMVGLGVVVYAVVLGVLVIALRRSESDPLPGPPHLDPDPEHRSGIGHRAARRLIIGGGVILPVVVIGVVYGATLETMLDLDVEPVNPLVVEVTASRWQWSTHYPASGVELIDELVVPVGKPVEVRLQSADVIHSFWVPALAGKLDALPDRTNVLVIEASEPGRYDGRCAEFCGLSHADMALTVIALEPSDFDVWLQNPVAGSAAEGEDR